MNWQHIAVRTSLTALALTFAVAAPASAAIVINEVDSQPTDWVELTNTGAAAENIGGYVFKDSGNGNNVTIPAGTMLAPGAFYARDVSGLGNPDSVRLFQPDGTTLVDSFSYLDHAPTTWGRCPDGTGAFRVGASDSRGAANQCAPFGAAWPGGTAITEQAAAMFPGDQGTDDVSGIAYQPSGTNARGTLWAVQNSSAQLYKLIWDGAKWVNAPGWMPGKHMHYPNGAGIPDTEGVTTADGDPNALFVAVERDGGGGSQPAVLRIDTTGAEPLNATQAWDLSTLLPGLGANEGPEAIAFVPDSTLVARGFRESNGSVYNPANYPGHGQGLFFLGIEQTGEIVAFALPTGGAAKKIATIASGFPAVMDLVYEPEVKRLWAACDDTCNDQTKTLVIGGDGKFAVTNTFERPADMPILNNEGFALAPHAECANDRKPTFYVDDTNTTGVVLREGTINCAPPVADPVMTPDPVVTPDPSVTPQPTVSPAPTTVPTPQPVVDRTAPSLKVALKVTRKTGKLGVTTTLGEKSDLTIKVTARKNKKAKARTLLTSTRKGAATGKVTFTLTLKKSIRAKLRKGETVTISIVARDAAGNATTKTASVKVK